MSDAIDTLPIDDQEMTPNEYSLVHPYIKRTVCFMENNKLLIVIGALVFVVSMPVFDTLIKKIIPFFDKMPYILAVFKAIFIVVAIFLIKGLSFFRSPDA